jgi:DNA-binding CsgD family transcriptional regulator
VALSSTLAWTGAIERAEAVLSDLAGKAKAQDDQLRLALALSFVRFWGRYQLEEARSGLLGALAAVDDGSDPVLVATVYEKLAGMELQTGRPGSALAYAQESARTEGIDLRSSAAALPAAAALAHLGRGADSISLVDEALPVAQAGGHPLAVATLLFTRAGALMRMGQLEAARQLAEWLRDIAVSGGYLDATGNFGVLLAEVLLRQGRSGSAGRLFLDSAGLLAEHDSFGYRPWALAGLARTRAQAGEQESAAAALDEARRLQPIHRHFDLTRYLAEVDLYTLSGLTSLAVDSAKTAAAWARDAGLVADEAQALDALVRMEPSRATAHRLGELASATDSALVHTLAGHAQALVLSDPDALLRTAQLFAEMTAWWMAAEAALAASRILERRSQTRGSHAAERSSLAYRANCDGIRAPVAEGVGGPAPLTRREREIAVQAAHGRSSKQIAEGMYLSPRTVESHLYRVYVKLGVTDRAELAAALGLHPAKV